MSFVHHDPDLDRFPCMGCGRVVRPDDLYRDERHFGRSCCNWHPYHHQCTVPSSEAGERADACRRCGEAISPVLVVASLEWLACRVARPHDPRPGFAPLAWQRVVGPERAVVISPALADTARRVDAYAPDLLLPRVAPVHRDCSPTSRSR